MKAFGVFPGTKEVKLIKDHPEPRKPTGTEVTLKMLEVGICGTDKEICSFEYGTPPKGDPYLVLGHESLGEVIEAGPEAKLKVGDLIVPMVRRPCGHSSCLACRNGRQDFCYTGDFTERGIKEQHGFCTELIVDDEKYMNVVPKALREVAILVEPLTIAEKALLQLRQVEDRMPWTSKGYKPRAVVLGAGPVGLLGAMALIVNGYETFVYSRSRAPNPKAELCRAIGATYLSSEEITVEALAEKVGNIDLVYEAVGVSRVAFDVLKVLGTNGIYCFTGVPGRKAPIEVDTDLMMRNLVLKNQMLFGTVNAGRDAFENAIKDLATFHARWPGPLAQLITGRHPIEAFKELVFAKSDAIKNVIKLA